MMTTCFFFNCLALHKNKDSVENYLVNKVALRTKTLATEYLGLWRKYLEARHLTIEDPCPGVFIKDLEGLEETFQVGINGYSLAEVGDKRVTSLTRRGNPNYETMNLDFK